MTAFSTTYPDAVGLFGFNQSHAPTASTDDEISPAQNREGTSGGNQEEARVVEQLRNGEEPAFNFLVDRYHGRLHRLARNFVPSDALAEEVVQETWVAVLEGIVRFEGRSSLKTWIFKILMNRAKTKGQKENRYVPFSNVGKHTDEEPDGSLELDAGISPEYQAGNGAEVPVRWELKTPERLLVSKEARAQVERAIETLPLGQRQVITLRDLEDMDSSQVCSLLQITAGHQRVLLHRARTKVRKILNRYMQGSLSLS